MKKKTPKLGQHFLTGAWAAHRLANAAAVRSDETILEIGPGKGALTTELLATGARVVAVEKDDALVQHLQQHFGTQIHAGVLRIVHDDIRNVDATTLRLGTYIVAANIPYYITGDIIRQFLTAQRQPRALALLIQKEVADRIMARGGKESILSLSVKAYGTPRVVAKVPRGNFSPPPSVDSAILLIDSVTRDFFKEISEKYFFEVVRAGFASKRKFLASNLAALCERSVVLSAFHVCGLSEKVRAEDVTLAQWGTLTKALFAGGGDR